MRSRGFTLIELVAVIVLLGILAVTALPRFVNLSGDANTAVAQSIVGSFRTAITLLRSQWLVGGEPASVTNGTVTTLMTSDGWPAPATFDTAGCMALWGQLLESAPDIEPLNVTFAHESWSTLGAGTLCVYFYNNGVSFVDAAIPYFVYTTIAFPTTSPPTPAGGLFLVNF